MSIAQVMSQKLITLDLDDKLSEAKRIFETNKIHHILITEKGRLSGIITDRDLYKHLSPAIGTSKETHKDIALLNKKINLIMSRDLVTAEEALSLNESVLLFHDNHISCIPIVNDQFKPIGIITWRDILKVLALQYRNKLKKIP
jgi:acetoin utilization protein AcuB